MTLCETSSLKIRQEFSVKQSISPKGQRLKREQFDETVFCVTNTEWPHGVNCISSHNWCVVLFSARWSIWHFAGHPFDRDCISSCELKRLRICSPRAERGIASLRDPQVWRHGISLPYHVKEALCLLDIMENVSWRKEICNIRQIKNQKTNKIFKNWLSRVLFIIKSLLGHILLRNP